MSRRRVRSVEYRARRYANKESRRERRGVVTNCEVCRGTGREMTMVCYGGPPHEIEQDCQECRS